MSAFTEFDSFERVSESGSKYRASSSVVWDIGMKGSGWELTIPEGEVFDISVPWFMRWILSPHNRAILPAAAVHDRLLVDGYDVPFASSEFRRAARARGAGPAFAWGLFFATLAVTSVIQRGRGIRPAGK